MGELLGNLVVVNDHNKEQNHVMDQELKNKSKLVKNTLSERLEIPRVKVLCKHLFQLNHENKP